MTTILVSGAAGFIDSGVTYANRSIAELARYAEISTRTQNKRVLSPIVAIVWMKVGRKL